MKVRLTFEAEVKDENARREWVSTVSPLVHETPGARIADWYYEEVEDDEDEH
ncbi:hypothetical protein ACIOHC_35690 [Streptomyces sp. NPDC088252]|uniref:hypothetical protein n=1 Tax=Streptomyces sp. NPDC088252 TaxID=3365845 RepID=UPI0038234091